MVGMSLQYNMKNIKFEIKKNSKGYYIGIKSSNGNKFNHSYNRKQTLRKSLRSFIIHIQEGYYDIEDKT